MPARLLTKPTKPGSVSFGSESPGHSGKLRRLPCPSDGLHDGLLRQAAKHLGIHLHVNAVGQLHQRASVHTKANDAERLSAGGEAIAVADLVMLSDVLARSPVVARLAVLDVLPYACRTKKNAG